MISTIVLSTEKKHLFLLTILNRAEKFAIHVEIDDLIKTSYTYLNKLRTDSNGDVSSGLTRPRLMSPHVRMSVAPV